jgi:hypothetical protein
MSAAPAEGQEPAVPEDPASGRRVDVLLTEFKALRDEINQRATYCHTIININVIASGTVASFALGGDGRLSLLLVLPILGPVLGLLWLDHSYAIRGMGDYIARLSRRVNEEAGGDGTLLGWETHLDESERVHKILRFLPLGVPIGLLFAGIPLTALVRLVTVQTSPWEWVTWAFGAVMTLTFSAMWVIFLLRPWAAARSTAFSGTRGGSR